MDSDLVETVVAVTIIAAVLGSVLGGGILDTTVLSGSDDVEMLGGAGTVHTEFGDSVTNVSAESTLEDAVQLDGSNDSRIDASMDVSLGDSWSVCTYSDADSAILDTGETQALLGVETARYEVRVTYNDSNGSYDAWYYDAVKRSSHAASAPSSDPGSLTLVCAIRNADNETFRVARNTTWGAAANTTTRGYAPGPDVDGNWHGRLEETRVYPSALGDSQLADWTTEPALSVEGAAPAARVMYDTRDRNDRQVPVYFAGGSASLQQASFVDGVTGPELVEGDDYEVVGALREWWYGGEIVATDSGVLTGDGDVLFAQFDIEERSIGYVQLGLVLFVFLFLAVAIKRRLP